MKTTVFDFNLLEDIILDYQKDYNRGINKKDFPKNLEDHLNEYIRLTLIRYELPNWFSIENDVLIARIMRSIKEKLPRLEVEFNEKKVHALLDEIISSVIKLNIDRQKSFKMKLELNGKFIDVQDMPRIPLKDEYITYQGVDYLIEVIKWDITKGNTILKLKK